MLSQKKCEAVFAKSFEKRSVLQLASLKIQQYAQHSNSLLKTTYTLWQDASDSVFPTMWMQAIRGEVSMLNDKQTFSRNQTSASKRRWPRSKSEDRVRSSSVASLSGESNRNVAATPDIAAKAPVHTRGLTPENKVAHMNFGHRTVNFDRFCRDFCFKLEML